MIQSAAYNPFNPAVHTPPRAPERAAEPARVNPAERLNRPVNQVEPAKRDNFERGRNLERLDASRESEALLADSQALDALVGDFLARATSGTNPDAGGDSRGSGAPPLPALRPEAEQPAAPGGSLGFADLRSAVDYWASLNPQRIDPTSLPAPIAAYREVESGPTPSLGLSAFA